MAENAVIKEIICLKCKDMNTGRPRTLKPGDFPDGSHWERQVEAALGDPASYEIHRETFYSEEDEQADLSKIELKDMLTLSREKVSEIAGFYGIKDEGQNRSAFIDQIAEVMAQQEKLIVKYGLGQAAAENPAT